ncbi:protein translocase subunit SecF [Enterobacteriaceae endosymbiont of Donacia sparganii]|uniref:protein translocase subunit SecF n=1 Tax=Enterobacteriaceae endosymbiont of Donacia sparganii TaxID=2675785 RepID=UPI0014496F52|nr:protein translocase subunit SecF [Enterobacteriaceae endosymbiont of Donacia sparganii]QJC35643.1 protein translocase subunit SecF [Enterobacteriaceae endosymbiont of Donacia sparganii]
MYLLNNKITKFIKNKKLKYYNFMKWNKYAFTISSIWIIFSLIIIYFNHFNWGLDFTGGTIVELSFNKPIKNVKKIKFLLQKIFISKINIIFFKKKNIILIKLSKKFINNRFIKKKLLIIFNNFLKYQYKIKKIEFLGPNIDKNFIFSGFAAVLAVFLSISLYIGFRFEWNLSFSIILSLLHDLIITMGLISLLHIEIDLTIITSFISIISYSLNDSIIILDRIRENCFFIKNKNIINIINLSINQTIKRSIITSNILLIMLLNLYFFGGILLKNFAFIMIIGIIIGTLSSIYIVSAIASKIGIDIDHINN